jgi:D-glycero-beta-D-manno-heptose 1-phosphate adenylyltransferase
LPFQDIKQNPNNWIDSLNKKFIDPEELSLLSKSIKESGKTVVTLNGSFDLLHAGHLYILEQAKGQGDILIVALNSDHSIKRYKGSDRPLIPLKERMSLMSALSLVDYVTYFDEDDPRVVLSKIEPNIHVNGAEYGSECIEAKVVLSLGGVIHVVSRIEGLSTSNIIQKIKKSCD